VYSSLSLTHSLTRGRSAECLQASPVHSFPFSYSVFSALFVRVVDTIIAISFFAPPFFFCASFFEADFCSFSVCFISVFVARSLALFPFFPSLLLFSFHLIAMMALTRYWFTCQRDVPKGMFTPQIERRRKKHDNK
jgi:hypothetical protein